MIMLKITTVNNKKNGFTLIELMISIAIGLMIMAAVLTMFVAMVGSNNDNLKSIRLNQDLRAAMGLITRDLRRAGANLNSANNSLETLATNPFQGVTIAANEQGDANKCIVFSYDDSTVGSGTYDASSASIPNLTYAPNNPNELFGYRFDSANNEVESRQAGAACSVSNWAALTDSALVTITDLGFASTVVTEAGINILQITITLSGQLTNDATVSRTLIESVKIRNDVMI